MPRYILYAKLTAIVLVLASLALLLADDPWGPN
jgi:hypothetical protein